MKKHVFGRQLKRDANERKALFKNLLTSLVMEERIVTTEAKAKAIRAAADKLITKAKKGESAFARLAPDVRYDAVVKLVKTIAPRFKDRQGGYTRIIKVGHRVADNAPQVVMEWVEKGETIKVQGKNKKGEKEELEAESSVKTKNAQSKPKTVEEKAVKKPSILKKLVTRQKKG
jgi:large subunit ribosomal protein L17